MTKFEVTDAMVEAAIAVYLGVKPYNLTRHDNAVQYGALKDAITAAIEASGLAEENARLRGGIEGLHKIIRDSIKENDGPDRVWIDGVAYEGPLADSYFKALRLIQTTFDLILNKEPTP